MLRHTFALVLLIAGLGTSAFAGRQATATATVTAGYVSGVKVTDSGSGYLVAPGVSLSGGAGSGATAVAILAGDTVGQIIVLYAGSGYAAAPAVLIEAPPLETSVSIELVPR